MTLFYCNHNPVANNDSATTSYNSSVTINVLANDYDYDCDKLSISGTPTVTHGTVSVNSDGTLTFVPDAGFSGTASICYTVSDGHGGYDTATVSIVVKAPVKDYVVSGTAGNDLIDYNYTGDPEHDLIDHNDNSSCNNDDVVKAGAGNDTILSGLGNDTVYGEDGNDLIDGGAGNDKLDGGAGDDTFIGGAGNDTFTGGAGLDIIDYSNSTSAINVNLATGALSGGDAGGDSITSGIDGIVGTHYNDTLVGFDQQGTDPADTYTNVFHGMDGNDYISGAGGDDSLYGGADDDTILGGAGNDVIYGDDSVDGASGLDGLDPVAINFGSVRPGSETSAPNSAVPGSSVIYDNVATLPDGTQVSARLVLVQTSSSALQVDLASSSDYEILLNANNDNSMQGQTATFRMEFFNSATGAPVTLEPSVVFADLDLNGGSEIITINDPNLLNVGLPSVSSLTTNFSAGSLTVGATQDNIDPNDPDAQVSTVFGSTTSITFTMTSRAWNSGLNFGTTDGNTFNYLVEDAQGNDLLDGGDGDDSIYGGQGNDTLTGGAGNDSLDGGADDDLLSGGSGNDTLQGGTGNDTLIAGDGTDQLFGGAGNDELHGGGDNDVLNGGDGADTIFIDSLGVNGVTNTTVDGGSGGVDDDRLDISWLLSQGYEVTNIVRNPETNGAPGWNGQIQLYNPSTGQWANVNFTDIEHLPCFTPGAMIVTPTGECAVEKLRVGDKVLTRDNGIQEIAWVGSRQLSTAEMIAAPHLRPVLIKAGSLGRGLPERDLLVSPNHRMLRADRTTALYFEENEVLVAAKHLLDGQGVRVLGAQPVTYVHFMFANHEVVMANGAWTESFQPGAGVLNSMAKAQRAEILAIFPELRSRAGLASYTAARKTLKKHEATLLRR